MSPFANAPCTPWAGTPPGHEPPGAPSPAHSPAPPQPQGWPVPGGTLLPPGVWGCPAGRGCLLAAWLGTEPLWHSGCVGQLRSLLCRPPALLQAEASAGSVRGGMGAPIRRALPPRARHSPHPSPRHGGAPAWPLLPRNLVISESRTKIAACRSSWGAPPAAPRPWAAWQSPGWQGAGAALVPAAEGGRRASRPPRAAGSPSPRPAAPPGSVWCRPATLAHGIRAHSGRGLPRPSSPTS